MGLYQDLEDEIIADIARRVKKTGRYTETAELMAKSMVEQGYSAEKIQAEVMKTLRADKSYQMEVAENTAAYKQEVQDIIKQTVRDARDAGNELVAEAGDMAWNNDLSMWQEHGVDLKKPNSMRQLLTSFQRQTAGELKNLTRTMGFKNTVFGTTGVLNAYQREMDLALLKVATGTFSYDQAVNDCVHRLAQSGLRSIDYASGRAYQLDTAARMSVRTGLSQLSGKITEANLMQTGQDLVITSQHMGSRPEHVPWQNKVFSYSGKSKKYPDFVESTGYGTVTGLKGANCTHDFYPYWEGASIIPEDIKEPEPVKINGKEYDYYQVSQQQRKMERNIRATKREIEAQKAIVGDTTELQNRLRKQTADYKRFSAEAGVKVKNNRLRVENTTSNAVNPYERNRSGKRVVRKGKTTKTDGVTYQIDTMKERSQEKVKECYDKLKSEYNSPLKIVKHGAEGRGVQADTDILGEVIGLNTSNYTTMAHEFLHTLAYTKRDKVGLSDHSDFWAEIKAVRREYNQALARGTTRRISPYADESIDEFAAEAFGQFKSIELGKTMTWEMGTDTTYSKKVVDIVDRYFRKSSVENEHGSSIIKSDLQYFASKEKQYGKKIGKHAQDFGLDASNEADRLKMHEIIADIVSNKDEIRVGSWRGQEKDVLFFVKGNDVVITKTDGEFVTVLKDGVINSAGVKNARKQ